MSASKMDRRVALAGSRARWISALRGPWSRENAPRKLRRLWRLFVGSRLRRPAAIPYWLRVGGLVLWGAVGGHILLNRPALRHQSEWLVGFLVFGIAYWRNTSEDGRRRPTLGLVALQSAIALWMLFTSDRPITSFLFLAVVGQLALSEGKGIQGAFIVLQTVGIAIGLNHLDPLKRIFLVLFFLVAQLFVAGLCRDALAGLRARRELHRALGELRATRDLLAQSSRLAERVRISRELHDLLGHHLTALNLHLEVLSHLAEGRVLHHATQAQTLAKLLLGDVRAAVSAMRAEPGVSLDASLSALVETIPRPRIHLDIPAGLSLEDPDRAHALLRCVQEIVTNAVRHSGAENLWIEVAEADDRVELRAHDDGHGVAHLQPGNGLKGLSQRLAAVGGSLQLGSTTEEGFRATVQIPVSRRATR
jgi:signal transduction histidine kinase